MKRIIFISLIIAHCALNIAQAQVRQDRSIIRGNVTSITVKYPGDITADSLFFQVRTNSSYTSTKHIEKENTVAGGSDAEILATYAYPYTTVKVFFSTANTSGLTIANYYYDLRKSVSPDSAVLVYGTFKIQSYAGENVNNLAGTGGGLSESSVKSWIGDTANVVRLELADYLLEADTMSLSNRIDAIDLIAADSTDVQGMISDTATVLRSEFVDKSSTQTITGQKNFSGTIPIKLNSDSSLRIGGYYGGVPVGLVKYQNPNDYPFYQESIVFPPDTSKAAPWRVGHTITEWDINRVGTEWSYGIEYNPSRVGNKPWMAFAMEPEYEVEEGDPDWVLYEWWYQFDWPASNIQYTNRPFQITQLVPYSGNPDSIQAQGVLSLGQLWMGTPLSTGYMLDWQFRDNDFSYLQIADTFKILYVKNNLDWLMQATSPAGGGSNISMIKVNDNDEVEISPTAGYKIKLGNNLSGSLGWRNEGNTADITIEPDSNNVIQVSNDAGISVSNLKIRGLTTDTTGSQIGDLYVDANTGNVKYVLGENLITNGDFNEWTAGVPDNWVTDTPDTTNFYYENDTGQLHFIQSTGLASAIYQGTQSVGVTYGYSFNVTQILDTFYVFEISGNTPITQTGYYTGQSTSTEVNPLISIVGTYGHCEITIDNIKVWDLNGAKQPIYESHQTPITINGVTVTDTVFMGRMENGAIFDSIRVFDVQDSIAIQLFYRNPTDNDLITTVDTLTTDTTITFDTTTIPSGAKVYMYPVYVGDSEAYLRSEIYWRN